MARQGVPAAVHGKRARSRGMVALLVSVWIGVGLLALIAWKLFMLY